MHHWMAIDTSRDGDRSISEGLSFSSRDDFLGWRAQQPWMAIDASRDGDRCIMGWRSMHPGMVIMHPRMVTIASQDGDLDMAIDASRDGDRCITAWRSIHPGMAIDASRD